MDYRQLFDVYGPIFFALIVAVFAFIFFLGVRRRRQERDALFADRGSVTPIFEEKDVQARSSVMVVMEKMGGGMTVDVIVTDTELWTMGSPNATMGELQLELDHRIPKLRITSAAPIGEGWVRVQFPPDPVATYIDLKPADPEGFLKLLAS